MRSTVIPAQVTTVEDTIAGNLTLIQIILLILPVLLSTAIYAVLPAKLTLTAYKIPLIAISTIVFIMLSLRIKGRIVLHWLSILATYFFRPHIFVFDKNTVYAREVIALPAKKVSPAKVLVNIKTQVESEDQEFDYQSLKRNTDLEIRFTRKGLLLVKNYD